MKSTLSIIVMFVIAFIGFTAWEAFTGKTSLVTLVRLPSLGTSSPGGWLYHPTEIPTVLNNRSGSNSGASSASGGSQSQGSSPSTPAVTPPLGFTTSQLSPYYQKVRISGLTHPYSYADTRSQFTISFDSAETGPVDITGWTLKGNGAYGISIPTAVFDYQQSTFGYTSSNRGTDHIVLRAGERATFYSWVGEMRGISFRLNKCTGYLNEQYNFSPSLPNECPRIDDSRIVLYSGKCQDFIRSMSTCRMPNFDAVNQITGPNDVECKALILKQNYSDCYAAHRNDSDFFSKEWRVWLNQNMPFDFSHDRVVLYDARGKVVDVYTY